MNRILLKSTKQSNSLVLFLEKRFNIKVHYLNIDDMDYSKNDICEYFEFECFGRNIYIYKIRIDKKYVIKNKYNKLTKSLIKKIIKSAIKNRNNN